MKKPPTNIAAAVRGRLLKLARDRGDDFQLVLLRYVNERPVRAAANDELFVLQWTAGGPWS